MLQEVLTPPEESRYFSFSGPVEVTAVMPMIAIHMISCICCQYSVSSCVASESRLPAVRPFDVTLATTPLLSEESASKVIPALCSCVETLVLFQFMVWLQLPLLLLVPPALMPSPLLLLVLQLLLLLPLLLLLFFLLLLLCLLSGPSFYGWCILSDSDP